MNIIVAIIVRLKRAPECIKTHHLEGQHANFFFAEGHSPLPRPNPHWGGALPRSHPVGAASFDCLRHLISRGYRGGSPTAVQA